MLNTAGRASFVLSGHQFVSSNLRRTAEPYTQTRSFVNAFLSSALGPCPVRKLSHSKVIPYSRSAVFKTVSDVSVYPAFLPFTISSNVTNWDSAGYPTHAKLKVGYEKLGLQEDWDSVLHCDPQKGIVEAKSSKQTSGGLFEQLSARWQIGTPDNSLDRERTPVKVEIEVKFCNSIYDQMFSQVQDKVAASMMSAFESRVRDLESRSPTTGSQSRNDK